LISTRINGSYDTLGVWVEHVACMGEIKIMYEILVRKSKSPVPQANKYKWSNSHFIGQYIATSEGGSKEQHTPIIIQAYARKRLAPSWRWWSALPWYVARNSGHML
jgi:hypothetical protein